jgi:hypothetical protein
MWSSSSDLIIGSLTADHPYQSRRLNSRLSWINLGQRICLALQSPLEAVLRLPFRIKSTRGVHCNNGELDRLKQPKSPFLKFPLELSVTVTYQPHVHMHALLHDKLAT